MTDCGSCKYEHDDYSKQLMAKQKLVEKLLGDNPEVEPIIGMNFPYYYRNKIHYALAINKNKKAYAGLYKEFSRDLIKVDHCLIEDSKAQKIVKTIVELINSFKYSVYDEHSKNGLFRRILIRTSYKKHELMLTLVLTSHILPGKKKFIKALLDKHPEISTIVININDRDTPYILGDKEYVVFGKGHIEDILLDKTFRISSKSFYQVNPNQTAKLYAKAIEYADLKKTDKVIDAYSGIGTIGIITADYVQSVVGVESNQDAVRDAIKNARINNIKNIYFHNLDASEFMESLAEDNQKIDVVFTDPPRRGSDKRFIKAIGNLRPEKVVYISCNPYSLQRDLQEFKKTGYELKKVIPVDMFPWTSHVETVVLMSRVDK